MAEAYLGQIIAVGFKFAPPGWALCDGSPLLISGNEALFSLLGTRYGGDGVKTFALPDLRGRLPIHQGQGAGLANYDVGQNGGEETCTLTNNNTGHTHSVMTAALPDTPPKTITAVPGPTVTLTKNLNAKVSLYADANPNQAFNNGALWAAGQGQAHENRQPFLVINFIICTAGIYPSQS